MVTAAVSTTGAAAVSAANAIHVDEAWLHLCENKIIYVLQTAEINLYILNDHLLAIRIINLFKYRICDVCR